MLHHPEYTRERIRRLGQRIQKTIYSKTLAPAKLLVSRAVDRITWQEARGLKYRRARIGQQFGPQWSTFWFDVAAQVPPDWKGGRVDLLWLSHSEAALWIDGKIIQGLSPERTEAALTRRARAGQRIDFQVEMACNGMFGKSNAGKFHSISPFVLDRCEIGLFDPAAWSILHDFEVLRELEDEMARDRNASDAAFAGELLYELNRFTNVYQPDDRRTWPAGEKILKALYTRTNATRVHELSAIGHAHIDTAWLWPLAETNRKCARTFASQVAYMGEYPHFKFACSQACLYEFIKRDNPDLYRRIVARVKAGQFVPVGGTWVEPDCNIPSGEALVRQFLFGQRFFQREFGIRCREFWNPDVFGYNGQLPQIMKLAGIERFLTQKLSWNRFNKPRHHTFTWQGIDGSEVLAHFPPADTYNAMADVKELRRNARDYKDHERSRHSLMLFGYGDGGGGPTRRMIEYLDRARDLQGLPRTQIRGSDEFFSLLEADCTDRPTIVGELYFEYHRGTYTTQALTKNNNRRSELLLHDVEFLAAMAAAQGLAKYPADEINSLWKLVLVNQFHDILPGSSIKLVYKDTAEQYAQVARDGAALRDSAAQLLVGIVFQARDGQPADVAVINTTGFDRAEVVALPTGKLAYAEAPSCGMGAVDAAPDAVIVKRTKAGIVLENGLLRAVLGKDGRVMSMVEKSTGRSALAAPGNVLHLFEDRPTAHDAWDVDPFYMETGRPVLTGKLVSARCIDGLRAEAHFEIPLSSLSNVRMTVRLDAGARRLEVHCDVDWNESHQFLRVAFPVSVRAMNATYEMQFGNVERPTHYNTTYDLAKFEVPGHRWSDLSEHGFGVALLSESKYGYSTYGNTMWLSLLRSQKSPDESADIGRHRFAYAIYPHAGGWREAGVVGEAARFNSPLLVLAGKASVRSLALCSDANLVLDTIKKAEDSDDLILRLYECHGARGRAKVRVDLPVKAAALCNILEEPFARLTPRDGVVDVEYGPYQIVTLMLRIAR